MLPGMYGIVINSSLTEVLYDRTTGTNIGNMTTSGGLAASFDGNTNQDNATASAMLGATGYVGKTLTAARPLSRLVAYGANNFGFSSAGTAESVTLRAYGKNGTAPSSGTDGTQLATTTFTDFDNNTAVTLNSTDTITPYNHLWLYISSGANVFCAELQIYVMQ